MPARHCAGIIPYAAPPPPRSARYDCRFWTRASGTCLRERIVERSTTVSSEDHRSVAALTGAQSRRVALQTGGALLAGMSALASRPSVAAQATPVAEVPGSALLVQSFSQGSLFPTQGDGGGAPYTVILWDAADRGFFFADWTSGVAGVVASERVLAGIRTEAPPRAV